MPARGRCVRGPRGAYPPVDVWVVSTPPAAVVGAAVRVHVRGPVDLAFTSLGHSGGGLLGRVEFCARFVSNCQTLPRSSILMRPSAVRVAGRLLKAGAGVGTAPQLSPNLLCSWHSMHKAQLLGGHRPRRSPPARSLSPPDQPRAPQGRGPACRLPLTRPAAQRPPPRHKGLLHWSRAARTSLGDSSLFCNER